MTFAPSAHQQAIFDFVANGKGSAIVVARAGSGKSTTIVEAVKFIPTTKSVTILAFNRAIAEDVKGKVAALGRTNVQAKTFHSLGFGAVAKYIGGLVTVDGGKVRKLARASWPEALFDIYGEFSSRLVGLAKGEGIGALVPDTTDAWYGLIQHHDLSLDSDDASEARAVELARELLGKSNAAAKTGSIDFDDQLYLVILWKLRLWQNDFLFVDEAQDTNPVRRALARLALRPNGRLIAVGDDKQAIYGFTGASSGALDLIATAFDAKRFPLTVSYRCPKAVVALAQTIVPDLQAAEGAAEGEVLHVEDIAKAGLGSQDAVLCRQTAPLVELAFGLIGKGTACKVLGREIGDGLVSLIKKQKAKGIEGLLEKLEAWKVREVARFIAKGEEVRAEGVEDRVACILTVIAQLPETQRTVPALIERISNLFADENGCLTLSTIHKAKGREWDRVAIIRSDLLPSKWARQAWQQLQERNLIYVAYTRARKALVFVA